MLELVPLSEKQNGWNCFDLAVGFERHGLIEYALQNIHLTEFRQLLAPEIRHAAAITVVYMNGCDETELSCRYKQIADKLETLFMLADALKDKADALQLEAQAYQLMHSTEKVEIPRLALPLGMHTPELQRLVNDYMNAHEDMRDAVTTCNQTLGNEEGSALSLEQLDQFFSHEDNQQHTAYGAYQQQRQTQFTPFETAFNDYCSNEAICRQYINEYYAKRGWFSFQRNLGEASTSMIDIVAGWLKKSIIIRNEHNLDSIIYTTESPGKESIDIAFNGYNHFTGVRDSHTQTFANPYHHRHFMRPSYVSSSSESAHAPPVLTPTNYSQTKRTDLLPGFSGSLYQGEVAIAYMLDGLDKGLHYEIFQEIGEADKWDDIKIIYADKVTRASTKVLYIQSKHGYDKDSYVLPANFYNKSGRAELTVGDKLLVGNTDVFTLPMYFDDWLNLLKKEEFRAIFSVTELVLYSNRAICPHAPGFMACFSMDTHKLTTEFVEGTGAYKKTRGLTNVERGQIKFRKKLFQSLMENSAVIKNVASHDEKEKYIKAFLRMLIFNLGQHHIDELESDNLVKIKKIYPHASAEAIYYAFRFKVHRWIRDKATATSLTDEAARNLLNESATRYLKLGEHIGVTNHALHQLLSGPSIILARDNRLQAMSDNLRVRDAHLGSITLITGPSACGKSVAIAQWLVNQLSQNMFLPGEFLYISETNIADINADELLQCSIRMLVIDLNNVPPSDSLIILINKMRQGGVSVIVIVAETHQAYINNADRNIIYTYLTKEEIHDNLERLGLHNKAVKLGAKQIRLSHYDSLYGLLKKPKIFTDMIQVSYEATLEDQVDLSDRNQPKIYIEQEVNLHVPVYDLAALLTLNTRIECALIKCAEISCDALVDALNKNFIAYKISMRDLLAAYRDDKLDVIDVNKDKKASGDFIVVITELQNSLNQIPHNLRLLITKQCHVIYLVEQPLEQQIASLYIQKNISLELSVTVDNMGSLKLPKPQGHIPSQQNIQLGSMLVPHSPPPPMVLVAGAGAGKTTASKALQAKYLYDDVYHMPWVCRVRLSKLHKDDNNKPLLDFILSKTKKPLAGWQVEYIHQAILSEKLLLILDGWDEVKDEQHRDCGGIIATLFKYPNLIVTTRPNDLSSIPLEVFRCIILQPFNDEQIKRYVHRFFGNSKFSNLVCKYLETHEARDLNNIIGIPMLCFLLCKVLQPYYQQWLEDDNVVMPWETKPLLKSRLYELFICTCLQEYLKKHEGYRSVSEKRVYQRCQYELERLRNIAFSQLFNLTTRLTYDSELDAAISYFGVVEPILKTQILVYHFKHQTYLEYFAAMHIARLLTSSNINNYQDAMELIKQFRYHGRYRLVWQFLAGILSYGDWQLKREPSEKNVTLFWTALCAEPVDLIGVVHNELINECLLNSNRDMLQDPRLITLFDKLTLPALVQTATSSTGDETSRATVISSSSETGAEVTEIISFEKTLDYLKKYIKENACGILYSFNGYKLSHVSEQINELVRLAETQSQKEQLISYLTDSSHFGSSLVVLSATAEALSNINIVNDGVIHYLSNILSRGNKVKLKASQALLHLGVELNQRIFQALISASADTYNGGYTRISREALTVISSATHKSKDLMVFMLDFLSGCKNEQMVSAIFSCLSGSTENKDDILTEIRKTKFNKKYHAYAYLALSKLGHDYIDGTINSIIDNNLENLIEEMPWLIQRSQGGDIRTRAIDYLLQSDDTYQKLRVLRNLLEANVIHVSHLTLCISQMFSSKGLTEAAMQLLLDYNAVDDVIIEQLLKISRGGFWLVDGGLPAVGLLSRQFNGVISKYLCDIIHHELDGYGVRISVINCCKKLMQEPFSNSTAWQEYACVLKAFFIKTLKESYKEKRDYLSLLNFNEHKDNLSSMIEAVVDNYQATREPEYLAILLLLAKKNSLVMVCDGSALTIQDAHSCIQRKLEAALAGQLNTDISLYREEMLRQDILPVLTYTTTVTYHINPPAAASKLVQFSGFIRPTQEIGPSHMAETGEAGIVLSSPTYPT